MKSLKHLNYLGDKPEKGLSVVKPIKSKDLHIRAFLTHFELACEFGILITLGDLAWLLHDIYVNGFNFVYAIIGMIFIIGLIGTTFVLHRHHKVYTHRLVNKIINHRIKQKSKSK